MNTFYRCVLAFLAFLFLAHAPWRVTGLYLTTIASAPGPWRAPSGNEDYWKTLALEARLIDAGWAVRYLPGLQHGAGFYGTTEPKEHLITIDADLSWNARFAVLAHEGGHTLARSWMSYAEAEVFAETVSYLVAGGRVESARYLAGAKPTVILTMPLNVWAAYRAAATLEDR